jgi:hypothetical protein
MLEYVFMRSGYAPVFFPLILLKKLVLPRQPGIEKPMNLVIVAMSHLNPKF